jgi:hypothetical protein
MSSTVRLQWSSFDSDVLSAENKRARACVDRVRPQERSGVRRWTYGAAKTRICGQTAIAFDVEPSYIPVGL